MKAEYIQIMETAFLLPNASSCVVKLALDFGFKGWAVGTGFLLAGVNGPCVATAFHNCSGGISPMARFKGEARPNPLHIEMFFEGQRVARFAPYGKGCSLFRVHPDMERAGWCDVAVLDLDSLRHVQDENGASSPFWTNPGIYTTFAKCGGGDYALVTDMFLAAGHDALVFGYPGGRDFHESPIGVSCKIAALTEIKEPRLLLSGHTSAGCSGAPVVAREFGGYFSIGSSGLVRRCPDVPLVDQWLGLYSGRLENIGAGPSARNTQIGVVWSARIVREVADMGVHDPL